jgi:hypothetical protein
MDDAGSEASEGCEGSDCDESCVFSHQERSALFSFSPFDNSQLPENASLDKSTLGNTI